MKFRSLLLIVFVAVGLNVSAVAAVRVNVSGQNDDAAQRQALSTGLVNRDPEVRRMAAEEIARRAEPWFKNMVDGCRLQEKDSKVKLALDWALYRLGENKALFEVIKSLDSGRHSQAVGYLKELEAPEPLYMFLPKAKKNTQVGIFEALGTIGNSSTLNVIRPYRDSTFRDVAKAAAIAEEQIALREKQSADTSKARPRRLETQPEKRSNR
jgi:hypothetical protein